MGIGFRIKELLREKNLKIKDLAELAGVPLNTLYSITKRDSERVDPVILEKIAKALNVTTFDLKGIKPKICLPISKEDNCDYGEQWEDDVDVEAQAKIATRAYAEAMGFECYYFPSSVYGQMFGTRWDYILLDKSNGKRYLVKKEDIEKIYDTVNSFLKFQFSELITGLHEVFLELDTE